MISKFDGLPKKVGLGDSVWIQPYLKDKTTSMRVDSSGTAPIAHISVLQSRLSGVTSAYNIWIKNSVKNLITFAHKKVNRGLSFASRGH